LTKAVRADLIDKGPVFFTEAIPGTVVVVLEKNDIANFPRHAPEAMQLPFDGNNEWDRFILYDKFHTLI
jgi:hypothetical protein